MNSINVDEVAPGEHRLYLIAGTTGVDSVIAELGHEPNGVFWEGVAELLIVTEAPHLEGRFEFDSEAGAFLAYSPDRAAVDELATRLREATVDADRIRQLLALGAQRGFEFDD
ncbi:Imm51 family immunity protein [Dactylosporangium sp. CA-139066]|uniref:Imm51 family immunity protein n=1 Tax=Dactylosporangium sp. CA-139066 TaxID=3239930 RepID=UPI003D8BAA54